jgi:probable O-glycosylation ligase (exosortase A-associated)
MRDLVFGLIVVGLLVLAAARPFVGVLLMSWISFMNPHQTLYGFATGMPWALLAFCATLMGCMVAGEPRRVAVNAVTALLFLFLLCITLTSFTAIVPPERVWVKWEWAAKILVGVLLTAALLTDRRRIHALVWLMVIAIGYYGVKGGLFTLRTGGTNIVLGPPNSIIGDRNQLSVAFLVAIPLMNYLRMHSRHRLIRWGLIVGMVLTLVAAIGSQSRGALLGVAATAVFLWLRSPGKLLTGACIAAVVAAVVSFMPDSWWQRMDTVETYEADESAMGRVQIWIASIQIALAFPWTGAGFYSMYTKSVLDLVAPGTRPLAAHSIWLEVLGEHGFPTFLVWLGVLVAGILYSMRILQLARGRPDLAWAADLARMSQVSMVAYVSAGTFVSLSYWDLFWTLMVVLGATHYLVVHAGREEPAKGWAGSGTGAPLRQAARAPRAVATASGPRRTC